MALARPLAVAASLALAGCSAIVDPDKIAPAPGPATIGALCQQVSPILEQRFQACTGAPVAWVQDFFGGVDCAAMEASVAAGRMAYDPAYGNACIQAVQTATCQALFFTESSGPPGACGQAIVPMVPTNGTCYSGDECQATDYCLRAAVCGAGTCRPRAVAGAPCSPAPCQSGLICLYDPGTTAYSCQAPLALNQPCPAGYGCAAGLYCDFDQMRTPQNLCLAQHTSGSCTAYDACQRPSYVCSGNNVAWNNPGQCQRVATEGQSCKHGYGDCVMGTFCRVAGVSSPAAGTSGSCTAFPGPGGTCGQYGFETVECTGGWCNAMPPASGTCQGYLPLNAACSGTFWDECGKQNRCDGTVCRAGCN